MSWPNEPEPIPEQIKVKLVLTEQADTNFYQEWEVNDVPYTSNSSAADHYNNIYSEAGELLDKYDLGFQAIVLAVNCNQGPSQDGEEKIYSRAEFEELVLENIRL